MAAAVIGAAAIATSAPSLAQGNLLSIFPSPQNDDVAGEEYPVLDAGQAAAAVLHARDLLAASGRHARLLPRFAAAARRAHLLFRQGQFQRNAIAGLDRRRLDRVPLRPDRQHLRGACRRLYVATAFRARQGEGGTRLLTQEQDPLNVIGQIYGRIQIFDQEIRGGRMLVDTPLINPQDNRMVPNTFEGVQLVSLPDKDRMYDYAVGYLWNIKPRDSNDFISMSDALAGADVVNQRRAVRHGRVRPLPGLTAIVMDYYIQDFINTALRPGRIQFPTLEAASELHVRRQRHRSAHRRREPARRTPFETYQFSAKGQMSYMGWTLFAAGSITGERAEHRLAVRHQAELYRHAAGVVRQRQREGDRRQRRL